MVYCNAETVIIIELLNIPAIYNDAESVMPFNIWWFKYFAQFFILILVSVKLVIYAS